jgi:hypothetical protein
MSCRSEVDMCFAAMADYVTNHAIFIFFFEGADPHFQLELFGILH